MLQELKRAAQGSVLETHPHYRTAIGVLGVALPVLLIISSLMQNQELESSISEYYFTSARDWFVGTLGDRFSCSSTSTDRGGSCVSRCRSPSGQARRILVVVGGIGAVVVALFPTTLAGISCGISCAATHDWHGP
jgi:hypothetical protein